MWVPHDTRDQIVDFVRRWSETSEIGAGRFRWVVRREQQQVQFPFEESAGSDFCSEFNAGPLFAAPFAALLPHYYRTLAALSTAFLPCFQGRFDGQPEGTSRGTRRGTGRSRFERFGGIRPKSRRRRLETYPETHLETSQKTASNPTLIPVFKHLPKTAPRAPDPIPLRRVDEPSTTGCGGKVILKKVAGLLFACAEARDRCRLPALKAAQKPS